MHCYLEQKLIPQWTTVSVSSINSNEQAAGLSGLSLKECESALSSIIRHTALFCNSIITLLNKSFCSSSNCPFSRWVISRLSRTVKYHWINKYPACSLPEKNIFPLQRSAEMFHISTVYVVPAWIESSYYFLAACHILMKHRAI